jgi:hypothetical protein
MDAGLPNRWDPDPLARLRLHRVIRSSALWVKMPRRLPNYADSIRGGCASKRIARIAEALHGAVDFQPHDNERSGEGRDISDDTTSKV